MMPGRRRSISVSRFFLLFALALLGVLAHIRAPAAPKAQRRSRTIITSPVMKRTIIFQTPSMGFARFVGPSRRGFPHAKLQEHDSLKVRRYGLPTAVPLEPTDCARRPDG